MMQVFISCGIGAIVGAVVAGYLSLKLFTEPLLIMLSSMWKVLKNIIDN